jgi:diguanylate cyclase (GGDEF)-like protein
MACEEMSRLEAQRDELSWRLEQALRELEAKDAELRREADRRLATAHEMQEREYRFRFLASRDPLTGALNRRSFIDRAAIELEWARERQSAASLAMLDVDYFKRFNDRHGHLAGDEALKHLVRVVSGTLRKTDFLGRYGGEEFVVFFPDTRFELCRLVCERALQTLAAAPAPLPEGAGELTASVGFAQASWENILQEPGIPDAAERGVYLLIGQADAALRHAKQSGRNRAVGYSDEQEGSNSWGNL